MAKARFRALIRWLLGDLEDGPRDPRSGVLMVWALTFAAIGMWFGLKHGIKGGPLTVGAWRMAVHGGVPLIGVALWELHHRPKTVWSALGMVLTAVLTGAIGYGLTDAGASLYRREPWTLVAAVLPVAAGLVSSLRLAGMRLSDWGMGLGDWRWWLPHHGVLLALLIPFLVAATCLIPPLAAHYPMHAIARTSVDGFIESHTGIWLDFIGWEFLFRGFLLFAFAKRGDALGAVLVQAMPFFLLHYPKPEVELVASYVGGIFAGWFCLRAGSFWPLYVIHVTMMTTVGMTSYVLRNGWP